jgi:hypothetical protein
MAATKVPLMVEGAVFCIQLSVVEILRKLELVLNSDGETGASKVLECVDICSHLSVVEIWRRVEVGAGRMSCASASELDRIWSEDSV